MEEPSDRTRKEPLVPLPALIVAILLSTMPLAFPLFWWAFVPSHPMSAQVQAEATQQGLLTLAVTAISGVAIGVALLRKPDASLARWAVAGASTALLGGLSAGLLLASADFLILLIAGAPLLLVVLAAGALLGLFARGLLRVFGRFDSL